MWKKTAVLVTLTALPLSAPLARDSTGCGVGTMLFDGNSGVAPQVLAVTTNGTLGNQTFGISSGTLGCDPQGVVDYKEAKLSQFISTNMEELAADMASGGGQTLASLAKLMGIKGQDRQSFYRTTQQHFTAIYPDKDVTAGEVVARLKDVMAASPELKGYVRA